MSLLFISKGVKHYYNTIMYIKTIHRHQDVYEPLKYFIVV